MTDEYSIGIDLGTTYSCVGVWKNNRVEIIANDAGNRTTPSYVSFTDNDRFVGESAKNQVTTNGLNTIFDAKRAIGRNSSDELLQKDIKTWPFSVVFDDNNMPLFKVKYLHEEKMFRPEEISAMILMKMKTIAETYLGQPIKNAVITVPAYFNDAQRSSTASSGVIAGLNVLKIISEPTAAAFAYELEKKVKEMQNVIVYDLGGGTFDVSLLRVSEGVIRVLATGGNTHLGGEDFDQVIVRIITEELKKKHHLEANAKLLRKLKTIAENTKRRLSSELAVKIEFEYQDVDFEMNLSRMRFELECHSLFNETMTQVKKVLEDGKVTKEDIDDVVLVGGSTRIPKIKEMLSKLFGGKVLCESINPDEAVAYGATLYCATLMKTNTREMVLADVTPLGLGLETKGGLMSQMIASNQQIPCKASKTFSTSADNQTSVLIKIYEGMRQFTKDNNLLGEFELSGIPPAPACVPQIEVIFEVDRNGILQVSATDTSTKKKSKLVIENKERLSEQVVMQLKQEAERFEKEDAKRKEAIVAKYDLEKYLTQIKQTLLESPLIDSDDREKMTVIINEGLKWCEDNEGCQKEIYKEKQDQVSKDWSPIVRRLYEQQHEGKAE